MSQPTSLWNGFAVMSVGIILSLMLMATIGQIGDRTITTLVDIGAFEVNADWAAENDKIYTFQSLLFLCCSMPGLFGIIIFILSAVRRQKYEIQQEPQIDFTPQYGGRR